MVNLRDMRSLQTIFVYAAVIAILAALLPWNEPLGYLGGDSDEYEDYANAIESGTLLRVGQDAPFGIISRTPGFPMLVVLGDATGNRRLGLLIVHFVLASLCIVFLLECLQPYLPRPFAAVPLLMFYSALKIPFSSLMTEWSAACLLLFAYGTWVKFYSTGKWSWLYANAFVLAWLILVKPVFLFALAIPFTVVFVRSEWTVKRLFFVTAASFPLIAWVSFNTYRLGSFSLSPAGTQGLFGVAAMIAPAPIYPSDLPNMKTVLEYLNEKRMAVGEEEFKKIPSLDTFPLFSAVNNNGMLARDVRSYFGLDWPSTLSVLNRYNRRVLLGHWKTYLKYVGYNLLSLGLTNVMAIPTLLLPLYLLRIKAAVPVAYGTLVFFVLHAGNVVVVSFTQIMHNRYYNITYYPLMCISLLIAFVYFAHFREKERRGGNREVGSKLSSL